MTSVDARMEKKYRAAIRKLSKLSYLEIIYNQINSTKDIDEMLTVITDAATVLNECDAASLMLLNPTKEYLYFKIAQGDKSSALKEMRVAVGEGVAGTVAQTGQMEVINDVSKDERFAAKFDDKTGFQSRNILCVPLKLRQEIIGVLEVLNKTGDGIFTPEDIEILERLATAAALAIHNAKLLQHTRRQFQNLSIIHETNRSITSTLLINEVLNELVHAIARMMEVKRCSVMLVVGDRLQVGAAVGMPNEVLQRAAVKIGEGIAGRVAKLGRPVVVPDIEADELFARPNDYERYKNKSFISVPIKGKEGVLGVLNISNRLNDQQFHRGDMEMMEQLAQQAAVALSNATLYHDLEELMNLNSNILQSVQNGIIAVGADKRIIFANQAFGEIFEIEPVALMGKAYEQLIDLFAAENFSQLLDSAIDEGTPFENQEFNVGIAAGKRKILLVSASILRGPKGKKIGSLLVVADQTRERELQEHLKNAERLAALGQLTAGIAHEIRNPLNIIRGFSQLLQRKVKEDEVSNKNCDIVLQEVDRLNALVQDMLDFARPERLNRAPVELGNQLRTVVEMFHRDAEYELAIELNCPDTEIISELDEQKMTGVWLNLLRNAADAMEDRSGAVTITLREEHGEKNFAVVEVQDQGCGIAADDVKVLFTPFYSTKTKGTGLGLAIVHKVIEAHNGLISVASQLEVGTTFTVKVPLG